MPILHEPEPGLWIAFFAAIAHLLYPGIVERHIDLTRPVEEKPHMRMARDVLLEIWLRRMASLRPESFGC